MPARRFRLLHNPGLDRALPFGASERAILSDTGFQRVSVEIRSWPGYEPTPLRRLNGLASRLDLGCLHYKDEASRFGIGSFKALGGAYGALRVLQQELERRGIVASSAELREGRYAEEVSGLTISCASDGNHGRAVAWAAQIFGCRSVIYLPAAVSRARQAAIAGHGAEIVRVDGTFDDAVRMADEAAAKERRLLVSDHAYPGFESLPRDIMQGYTLLVAEAYDALEEEERPTHVFVQGGVGGLAAAVCAFLWEKFREGRPVLVVVEPEAADCLFRSAEAGQIAPVPGDLATVMGCLSAAQASTLGWKILSPAVDAFLAITDEFAVEAMRRLAEGSGGDEPVVAGESGAAGIAGLVAVAEDPRAREELQLKDGARVLTFGTEGANDPESYEAIVGRSAATVEGSAGAP